MDIDDELPFKIEAWDRDDQHVVEVLARATSITIARAAWTAALRARPDETLTLRHGTRIIEKKGPPTGQP